MLPTCGRDDLIDAAASTPSHIKRAAGYLMCFGAPGRPTATTPRFRKGRSLGIGFVLSSQSAGDVPERIRHNLNSVIIFRHRQPKVLEI